MEQEKWKDIPGYEGLYQASNLGNIKSLDRVITRKDGKINHIKEKIMKPYYSNNKYLMVNLIKEKQIKKLIHRLIAEAFIIKTPLQTDVNHKDGNRLNNKVDNLEWCTKSENHLHKYRVLGYKNHLQINHPYKGKFGNHLSKKVGQYDLEGNFIKEYSSQSDAKRETGISQGEISACCLGKIKQAKGFIFKFIY